MEDFSIIKCSTCGETKKRIRAGKYPDNRNTKWVDDQSKQFNGLCCPVCWSKKVADKKRYKAEENKRIKDTLK